MGRWVGIDPQPESAESMTPYQYAGNMPNMLNDPLGDKVNPDYVPVQPGWEDPHGIIATLRDFDEADARLAALMHGSGGGSGSIPGAIHISGDKAVQAFFNQLVNTGEVDFNPGKDGGYKFDYQYGRVVTDADGGKFFDMVGGSITLGDEANWGAGPNFNQAQDFTRVDPASFKLRKINDAYYVNMMNVKEEYELNVGPKVQNYTVNITVLGIQIRSRDRSGRFLSIYEAQRVLATAYDNAASGVNRLLSLGLINSDNNARMQFIGIFNTQLKLYFSGQSQAFTRQIPGANYSEISYKLNRYQ